jgi:uncharacterized protein YndB with AHSA1/START domain
MTPIDKTDSAQTETLAFEFTLAHPPEKVWRALTEPALLSQWLLSISELALEQGASFTLRTQPQPGWDGTVDCTLLEIEPHTRLSYTWNVGEWLETVVTFTLTRTESGTRVMLVQSGFKSGQKQNFGGARYGWRMMGEKLESLLERLS